MLLNLSDDARYGLAFSGGVDSSLLLALMLDQGLDVVAYTVQTAFQAPFEAEDADSVARVLHVPHEVLNVDVLSHDEICSNPWDRCYHCKRLIFGAILARMAQDARTVLVDGTNATDDPTRRPGFRALDEMGVRSPLRELGLSKDDIRTLSSALGLPTATKPSFSCYATHVPAGTRITADSLAAARPVADDEAAMWLEERDA